MTTNSIKHVSAAVGAAGIVTLGAALFGIFAEPAGAQQPAATSVAAAAAERPMLSLTDIEKRANAAGIEVTEIEVRGNVVKVEGRDGSNREVDLLVDRRSGEILSREIDD